MSTDTPKVDLPPYVIRLERENARLREELAEAKRIDDITMTAFATLEGKFKEQVQRAEQAETRALANEKEV